MLLEVLSVGSGLGLQDAGRVGWRRYGVPPGGAMDGHAMRAANRLLGNAPDAPVLEIQRQGAMLKTLEDCWLALAGADYCPQLPAWTAREVAAGTVLEFSRLAGGIYAYLAVPGGFVAERWFASVSTDPRHGLGATLLKGAALQARLRQPASSLDQVARRMIPEEERRSYPPKQHFTLLPGPQFEAFTAETRERLVASQWRVSVCSDRTGFRLEGPALAAPASIPSEPVLPGSFQAPGSGLIVTMPEGPTVGGYAKIAVLKESGRERLAQCAPGTQLRFQWAES